LEEEGWRSFGEAISGWGNADRSLVGGKVKERGAGVLRYVGGGNIKGFSLGIEKRTRMSI